MYTMNHMSFSGSPRISLFVSDLALSETHLVNGYYSCNPEEVIPLPVPMRPVNRSLIGFYHVQDKNSLEALIGVPVPEGANVVGIIVPPGDEGQFYKPVAVYFARLVPDADLRVENKQNYASRLPNRPIA